MKNIKRSLIALSIVIVAALHTNAQVSVGVSVKIGPPLLPVYTQPLCPGDGYLWIPGYWANTADGYYWVPGEWIRPPHYGLLWTPGYWSFSSGFYNWRPGYWGPHVGFYGGINYGFGYGGVGYSGGMWRGNAFHYNIAVTNVNTTVVHNTYVNKTVINNTTVNNRNSFNGQGGVHAKPAPQEQLAMREHHIQPTSAQLAHESSARADRNQFASVNHGRPARLAENGTTNYNRAVNRQNNTLRITHAGNNANPNRAIVNNNNNNGNNNNNNNNNRNANRQLPANGMKPERQPEVNSAQIRTNQMNAGNEAKTKNMNMEHVRNEQRNFHEAQPHIHEGNVQRGGRGNRH